MPAHFSYRCYTVCRPGGVIVWGKWRDLWAKSAFTFPVLAITVELYRIPAGLTTARTALSTRAEVGGGGWDIQGIKRGRCSKLRYKNRGNQKETVCSRFCNMPPAVFIVVCKWLCARARAHACIYIHTHTYIHWSGQCDQLAPLLVEGPVN